MKNLQIRMHANKNISRILGCCMQVCTMDGDVFCQAEQGIKSSALSNDFIRLLSGFSGYNTSLNHINHTLKAKFTLTSEVCQMTLYGMEKIQTPPYSAVRPITRTLNPTFS